MHHGAVHAFGDAGAQQDFTQQDEQRDGNQHIFHSVLPDDLAQCEMQRHQREEIIEDEPQPAEGGSHRHA